MNCCLDDCTKVFASCRPLPCTCSISLIYNHYKRIVRVTSYCFRFSLRQPSIVVAASSGLIFSVLFQGSDHTPVQRRRCLTLRRAFDPYLARGPAASFSVSRSDIMSHQVLMDVVSGRKTVAGGMSMQELMQFHTQTKKLHS